MLRKIILEDFMSHRRTEIDLADGLTVLTGPNNCGKSAIVAALQILATNGRTTHVMRHGANVCRITVETDDHHTIVWERKKNTVKYTLDGEDIHRVKSSTPESLHTLLRLDRVEANSGNAPEIYDIHFGEQKSPVFLLGESGSRAASFFASSSDASRLVEMQHRHRSNLRDRKADAKRLAIQRDKNEKRLKSFEPLDQIAAAVQKAERLQQEIEAVKMRIQGLHRLSASLQQASKTKDCLDRQRNVLTRIDSTAITPAILQQESERKHRLDRTIHSLGRLTTQTSGLQNRSVAFARLIPVPHQHDVVAIRSCIVHLSNLSRRQRKYQRVLDCSTPLISPPQMLPAQQCQRLVGCLIDANRRLHWDQVAIHALTRLQSPPPLEDCSRPQSLLRHLIELTRKRDHAARIVDLLASLQIPAVSDSTARLQSLISELKAKHRLVRSVRVMDDALGQLRPVNQPIVIDPLATTIAQLRAAALAVRSAQQTAKAAALEAAECENDLREFVKRNPTCQTCGGRIDPETLLSSAPDFHHHSIDGGRDE